jgi:hypothetical protein
VKRRLLAVVLNLLFLNASLPGTSPACVAGVESGGSGAHSEGMHHAAHEAGANPGGVSVPPAQQSTADNAPGDHQHERSHCAAMTTCSMIASIDARTADADAIPVTADERWVPPDAPHSVASGPEPPPPRA